jgi:hypothetical protein
MACQGETPRGGDSGGFWPGRPGASPMVLAGNSTARISADFLPIPMAIPMAIPVQTRRFGPP